MKKKDNIVSMNVDEIKIPRVERNIISGETYRIEEKDGGYVITCSEPNKKDYKLFYDDLYEAYEDYLFFIQNFDSTKEEILKKETILVKRYSQETINERVKRFQERVRNAEESKKYGEKTLFDF